MTRAKHGKYNQATGLPDNVGQPQGSGTIVWFQEQIVATLPEPAGSALIASSVAHGARRYEWLCEQLIAQGYGELAEAYQSRKRDDAAALRIRDKKRIIAQCEATISHNDTPLEHQLFLRKQIAKAQKYLEEHAEHAEGGTV
jgi:hypothetical protein